MFRLFCCGIATLIAIPSFADSITLEASKDNSLFEDDAGALSNGVGVHLFVGRTNQPKLRRALIAFDVGAIGQGSTITSVTLVLNANRAGTSGSTAISLHRVLADWGEGSSDAGGQEGRGADAASGDATWLHGFSTTTTWSTPGGDFTAAASASVSVGGSGVYTWSSSTELVADVQGWVDDSSANFGWILIGDEAGNKTAKRFASRENSSGPQLTVEFTPAAANEAPVVANAIADQSLTAADAALSIELTPVFSDADADELSYGVVSSDAAVATAAVVEAAIAVTPLAAGSAVITVTAADAQAEVSTSFSVAVSAPALTGDFDGDGDVDLSDFFEFADHFGETSESASWDPVFDLIADEEIDFNDFFAFADNFGSSQ